MTLEDQVVSLKLSKQIKKLGYESRSLFGYFREQEMGEYELIDFNRGMRRGYMAYCAAYTVAELGEILPERNYFKEKVYFGSWWRQTRLHCTRVNGIWECRYQHENGSRSIKFTDKSEANARAKLFIYLLENNLLG